MAAYYNEFDPFAAAWLRELINAGLIADGEVDERSIADVTAADVRGFTQCHFFAGIGGWSYALRLAGWPDDREVWTGSCPCQPFSAAGKGDGSDDPRHLWPAWCELIIKRRPIVVFGEQVASADGLGWFDRVSADLEAANYAIASADLCAAGVGAFHIRQRLWFVADADKHRRSTRPESQRNGADAGMAPTGSASRTSDDSSGFECILADATRGGFRIDGSSPRHAGHVNECESLGELGHAEGVDGRGEQQAVGARRRRAGPSGAGEISKTSFWADAAWIPCSDGKARPVEPGTFPLAHGLPARVGRLRGYGNAIVPQVAQVFIEAYMSLEE